MDAHELVEEFFPERLQAAKPGDGEKELPAFCQSQADEPLEVLRPAYARGRAEEEVLRGEAVGREHDGDAAAVRVGEEVEVALADLLLREPFLHPVGVVGDAPGHRRLLLLAEAREVRRQDLDIDALEGGAKLHEGFFAAAPAVETEEDGFHVRAWGR